jgi:polyisoprenyl-teichoic acid--peptidoglycan teichoic acid transferase
MARLSALDEARPGGAGEGTHDLSVHRPDPAVATRRAVTLVVLSLVMPGLAQYTRGNRRVGLVALRIWAGVVGFVLLVALLWVLARGVVLAVFTLPTVLSLLGVLLIVAGIAWPVLVVDAWRLGVDPAMTARSRRWVAVLMVVGVLVTSLPVIGAGRRVWAAGDLIGSVFGSGESSAAEHGRYNVLLLGGDAGANRIGLRPDSVTLASVDDETGRTVLFSFPRNLENVPFPHGSLAAKAMPDGYNCGDECLLNAIYQWGTEHKQYFPGVRDPGAEAMKQAVEGITGLTVNYYVLIDLQGFRQLIDAVGGVKVDVKSEVPIGGGTSPVFGHIKPGVQKLDGFHALWYSRSRHGSSDYERMARQKCVMNSMLQQLEPATVLRRFQKIAAAGKQVVSTDIPAGELDTFISLSAKARDQKVTSVQFVPPLITPARPDLGLVRSRVHKAIEAAEKPPAPHASAKPRKSSGSSGSSPGPSPSVADSSDGDDIGQICSAA